MVYGVCSNHQTRVCSRCTHTHFSADGRTDVTCGESRQDNTIQGCAHKKKKKASGLQFFSCPKPQKAGEGGGESGWGSGSNRGGGCSELLALSVRCDCEFRASFCLCFTRKKKKKMRGCIHPSTGSPETRKHPEEAFSEKLGEWEGGGMRWLEESKIGAPGALIMEAGKDSVPSTNPKAALFLGKLWLKKCLETALFFLRTFSVI